MNAIGATRPAPGFIGGDTGSRRLVERLTTWRFLPFETYPGLVTFAETISGRIILLLAFAPLLQPLTHWWLPITVAAGACAFAGKYRSRLVTAGTLGFLALYYFYHPDGQFRTPYWIDWSAPFGIAAKQNVHLQTAFQLNWLIVVLVFLFAAAAIAFVRRFREHVVARRPILSLHLIFVALLVLAASDRLHGLAQVALWSLITTLGAYFWFICYALVDQRTKNSSPISVQWGLLHPFWGSSTTPIGKGATYLRNVNAKDSRDLAVTQLKGLKLLMWVWVLKAAVHLLRVFAHDSLNIPEFDQTFAYQFAAHPYPWFVCWATLIYKFFYNMLYIAIWGDTMVACGRLAGYRMLRNSCRPLSSRTLADFWNRYYYYFKELLVAFFFFPTFLRYFKQSTRLRTFAATFMAAAVGNFIFHFMREINFVAELGLLKAVSGFQSYIFYCAVLASGIGISQMRTQQRRNREGWLRGQLLPSLGVLLFYCLLEIFSIDTYSPYSLYDRFSFLFHLFGADLWI